jgi:myo-inositol 2-dehydrogenase / D-chiro-inositol 1-dehydrogenase
MSANPTDLTVLIVGAGRRGRAHARALAQLPCVRIAAICDCDPTRADALAAESGARSLTDWRQALEVVRPRLAVVTTPPPQHAEQAIAALETGAHVLIEKPIALNLNEANAIGAAAQRHDRSVQVCQQHRYGVLADRAREALSGRRVALVHSWLYRQTPDIPGNWDRAWGGGHVVEWGIHHLDLCRYLLGEIETVSAAYGEQVLVGRPGWRNWDGYALSFRMVGGAVGSMTTTYAAWPGLPESGGLDIIADGLVLRFRGPRLELVTPDGTETVEESIDLTRALDEAFVTALQTGDSTGVRVSYEDAVRSLQVVLAANRSNEIGRTVRVSSFDQGE